MMYRVDLSPIVVSRFVSNGIIHEFKEPLILEPEMDDSDQLICLVNQTYGIDVFAPNREELDSELYDHLDFLWRNYVLEEDERLDEQAQKLKYTLLNAVK